MRPGFGYQLRQLVITRNIVIVAEVRHAKPAASGEATVLLEKRTELYQAARLRNPQRWTADVRNWVLGDTFTLIPNVQKCRRRKQEAAND